MIGVVTPFSDEYLLSSTSGVLPTKSVICLYIFAIVVTIIILAIITEICYLIYDFFTEKNVTDNISEVTQNISNSNEALFTKDNLPKIDASLATQPLVSAMINNFVGENVTDEEIDYSNTHPGYIKLIDGDKDLIVVTEPSKEELE